VSQALNENSCLQELYLYNNYLGDASMETFSSSLLQNKANLHTLGLEFNSIGSEGAIKVLSVAS
jgi:Leucine Rich repeat